MFLFQTADEIATKVKAGCARLYSFSTGIFEKEAGTPSVATLRGRLYVTPDNWGLLSVPNAIARGAFDALEEAGVELPTHKGRFNAHITVFRPEEIAQIGGADKITERGHSFAYSVRDIQSVRPDGWLNISKVWFLTVKSPELEKLRKSYGLSALPNDGRYDFHITFAVRRVKVLQENNIKKAESLVDAPREVSPEAIEPGDGLTIKTSSIEGLGLFTTKAFAQHEVIRDDAIVKKASGFLTEYEQSDAARFINHSETPSAYVVKTAEKVALLAKKPLKPGDEITVDYERVDRLLGPSYYYTWRGGFYDGSSSTGKKMAEAYEKTAHEKRAFLGMDPRTVQMLRAMAVDPLVRTWARGQGMVYPGGGDGPFLERLDNVRHTQNRMQAITGAGQADRGTYEDMLTGLAYLMGARPTENETLQDAIRRAAGDMSSIIPYVQSFAPELLENLHGWRGSAANLGQQVFEQARGTRDINTGRRGGDPTQVAETSRRMFGRMYGQGQTPAQTRGFTARRMGELMRSMSSRGMLGGVDVSPEQQSERIMGMAGPVAALRDVGAIKTSSVDMDASMNLLEQLTQGQIGNLDPAQVDLMIRRLGQIAKTTPGGLDTLFRMTQEGANLADSAGLERVMGTQTAEGSGAFGQAFNQLATQQGFGGLAANEARALDQRLRVAAMRSPLANQLGATVALADAGFLQPGTPGHELATAVRSGDVSSQNLEQMPAQRWVELMQASGVNPNTAWQQLRASDSNQEFVYRYRIGDAVRDMQMDLEIYPMMQNLLGQGLSGELGRAGFTGDDQRQAVSTLQQTLANALRRVPPNQLLGDRSQLINNLAAQLQQQHPDIVGRLGQNGAQQMVHSALTNFDQHIRSDDRYRIYQNMIGLLSTHRPDILRATRNFQSDAAYEASLGRQTAHLGQHGLIPRISDTIQSAGPNTTWSNSIIRVLGGEDQGDLTTATRQVPLNTGQRGQAPNLLMRNARLGRQNSLIGSSGEIGS